MCHQRQSYAAPGVTMRYQGYLAAALMFAGTCLIGWTAVRGHMLWLDEPVSAMMALRQGQSPGWLIAAMQTISWPGGGPQRTPVVVAIALVRWRWRGAAAGWALALAALISNWISGWLKLSFARVRPDLVPHLDNVAGSLSYPSGHATSVAVVYLAFALLGPAEWRGRLLGLAALLAFLTGLSRIMLGVHYASDVVGGWMLGTAFALLAAELCRRWSGSIP